MIPINTKVTVSIRINNSPCGTAPYIANGTVKMFNNGIYMVKLDDGQEAFVNEKEISL